MKRTALTAAILGPLLLGACGDAELVVRAELQTADVETPEEGDSVASPIEGLEVWLLPYDRDVIFDSLAQAAAEPEPQIPDSLLQLQDEVAAAQETWRQAEDRWNDTRARMKEITEQMDRLNRGEARYRELFREFQELEDELGALERRKEQAFQRFDSLQKAIVDQGQEIRLQREQWAENAFGEVGTVIERRLEQTGKDEMVDTTDASGTVRFQAPPGQWWVHARHELPYTELYWNEEFQLERGDPQELILNRENADTRPNL